MNRIHVGSVEEAVQAAEQLALSQPAYWFRGQAEDWPVRSAFSRLGTEDQQLALEKATRYEAWVKSTPGLEYLASDPDAAIAVAQHYGLATNFLDFSAQLQIAAFFASEKAGPNTATNLACIVCLDTEDLAEFWRPLVGQYPPPEFLELSVPDLWRIEAQRGRFLYCPYDSIEAIYDFDRILFPNTHVFPHIAGTDVYPERKSHLEILLDQYFMIEDLIEFKRTWDPTGFTELAIRSPMEGYRPEVFPNGLPDHPSWSAAAVRPWLQPDTESLLNVRTQAHFEIQVRYVGDSAHMVQSLTDQLARDALSIPGIRDRLVGWSVVVMEGPDLPRDFASRLEPRLARLWDGLRRLPYTDEELCEGLATCVALAIALRGSFSSPDARHFERAVHIFSGDPIKLEFGAADGSYSRGYASNAGLARAIRPDILSYMSGEWKTTMADNPHGILQAVWTPKKVFDFRVLVSTFARELVPYQVMLRDGAVFYSPARLSSLGLP